MTDERFNKNQPTTDPMLRMPEVCWLTGLSKATIYRMMKEGRFPKQYRLSDRAVGWKKSAISVWNENREPAV